MFRKEAIDARSHKLHGDVFLIQPISFSALGLFISGIVTFALILIATGSYARSEHVVGQLVPSKGFVKIQTSQFGTLESINVKEGDTVEKGQKLATISVSRNTLDGDTFSDKAFAALLKQEFELKTQITLETNRLETEISSLLTDTESLALKTRSLQSQLNLQRELGASVEGAFKNVQRLVQQGYISKEESKRRRQEWLRLKNQEKNREQELLSALSKHKQLQLRMLQLPNESKQRIARLTAQLAELEGRKAELSGRIAYAIISIVSGKVLSISVDSIGRSVRAGQALFTIKPENSVLKAELFVPTRAIGFVEKGQEVRLLYDAFPYQFFGSHEAIISEVTETVLTPDELLTSVDLRESVYRVTADIKTETILARDKVLTLQPGMTIKANIVLERRSFTDWIFEPLRAVRERT